MVDLREIFEEILAKYSMMPAQQASTAVPLEHPQAKIELPSKRLEQRRTKEAQKAFVEKGAMAVGPQVEAKGMLDNWTKYINYMRSLEETSRTGMYQVGDETRQATSEERELAGQALSQESVRSLMWYSGMAGKAISKTVTGTLKPMWFKTVRKLTGNKWSAQQVKDYLNKFGKPGAKFSPEEHVVNTKLDEIVAKEYPWTTKHELLRRGKTGGWTLPEAKPPTPIPKAIGYQPPYRPELPPEGETGMVGARLKPKPPRMTPAQERGLIAGKPKGAIVPTPATGEAPLIEQVYPRKPYDIMAGLAGGTPKTTIGGEAGMGGLPTTPPSEPPPPRTAAGVLGEPMPEPPDAVKLITDAIKATKPIRGKLEKTYTAERAKRIKEFEKVMAASKGQAGYFEALGQMKGELAPQPMLEEIQKKLTQPAIDELYEIIKHNNYYTSFEKMDIASALTRVLEGKLPQPHHYPLLENVFGKGFTDALMESKGETGKLRNIIQQAINLPKAVKASFDFSAPFRQSIYWMLRPTQIGKTAPAFGNMFKYAFSEKAYQGWYNEIKKDPLSARMRRYGLDITDPTGAHGLSAKAEPFMTDLPKIVSETPILKYTPIGWAAKGIRMSERAFTGFQNKLRYDVAKGLFLDAMKNGWTPGDPAANKAFTAITKYVNSTTGRGDIHRLGSFGAELNATFWSPRFIKARLDMFNPWYYYKLHSGPIRKKLLLGWAEAIGTGMTILTLGALAGKKAGVSVELDPRSSDFGKLRIGRTRFDIWGGHQQYIRVLSQLIAGSRKVSSGKHAGKIRKFGKQWPFETRVDVMKNFGRGKLAPIPQLAWELMEGQKLYGGELTPLETIRDLFIPMVIDDIREAYDEFGANALWGVGVPATFGVGVQTYEERGKKKGGYSSDVENMAEQLTGGK